AAEYRFFHWHLEFPEIFTVTGDSPDVGPEGWSGGFHCLLGNPPWEHTELKEQEFFAARDPDIAVAAGATRKQLIKRLPDTDPALWALFSAAKRQADGTSALARLSGRFPLTGRGRINTYAIFAETFRSLLGDHGRCGCIVPTGIATDATTQYFFRDLVESRSLAALYDFENAAPIFEGVHRSFKFALLTVTGRCDPEPAAHFAFFLHDPALIETASFSLTPEEILLLNPNTGTCPVFRTRRDAEITLGIYRRVPVLLKEGDPNGNPWGVSFMQGLFNMTSDSDLFHTRDELEAAGWYLDGNVFIYGKKRMLPLFEAKMIHHYDHRWGTYDGTDIRDVALEEKQDPNFVVLPRYWVDEWDVNERLAGHWNKDWLLGWRDICRSTDERTLIATMFPRGAVGNKIPLMLGPSERRWLLAATLSSFVCDFTARQKIGGTTMNYYLLMQLPTLAPDAFECDAPWDLQTSLPDWLSLRVIELTCTSSDMRGLGQDLGGEEPHYWDDERRSSLKAELDAAFFHLYGIERRNAAYILDTFPIVKRKDEAKYGEYRTKRLILEVYDRIAEAIRPGAPYQTILDPPPGQGLRHPAKQVVDEA
ncbi:MAG: Eco57I restriction-modification methylase domain-containing protein, partial [Gemmatimonadota bacterium]